MAGKQLDPICGHVILTTRAAGGRVRDSKRHLLDLAVLQALARGLFLAMGRRPPVGAAS